MGDTHVKALRAMPALCLFWGACAATALGVPQGAQSGARGAMVIVKGGEQMAGAATQPRPGAHGDVPAFPGSKSVWHGYAKYDFDLDGRACCVVVPARVAPGTPWIWRARFWGHEPQTDLALLSKGFHVVYMDVAGLYGSPRAVAHWNAFYEYLTGECGFARKPALEGMSRGGLIVFNWAAANPERVSCIYADAPVCDIKSWPGGKGKADVHPDEWQACLKEYALTEQEALEFRDNPIDHLEPLANAAVPLLHVCGAADTGVPVDENTAIVEQRYRALGGSIQVILKEGCGHHPHSLEDPAPIVDFILRNTPGLDPYVALREGLPNSRTRFLKEKQGRVAFLGGSITEMDGWRAMVCDALEKRFPKTHFDFVDAGIASTDSTLGAFRLQTDVFGRGRVDLLFVEFAVNDQHNTRNATERVRGMEGILRQARQTNPEIDIIVQYFVDPVKIDLITEGKTPPIIVSHDQVTAYYGIPVIDLAREVTDRINAGEFDWEAFGGLHPAPFGHRIYARAIGRLFDAAWMGPLPATAAARPYSLPSTPLDPLNYERGRYVDLDQATLVNGWERAPSWIAHDAATRKQFANIPMLVAEEPGATLKLAFSGTAVGLLVVAGPDVGILDFSIDDGPAKRVDQFTEWSADLHIPWAYILDADLAPGNHELTLRTTGEKNTKSKGCAIRIVKFLAN